MISSQKKLIFFNLLFFLNIYANQNNLKNHITLLPFFDSTAALNFIKNYLPKDPVIIEAGAFDGNETLLMSQIWPKGTIHAFEPVPKIYTWLTQSTKNCKNVHTYMYALSNKNGVAKFYLSEDPNNPDVPTTSGSLSPAKEHLKIHHYVFRKSSLVKTITLDSWAKKNNIKKVDLLWLDMQGHELSVLKSSTELLKTVQIIYTEAEFIEAYAGQPLYWELRTWLEQNGFKLIAQDAIEPSKKHWCCNCVFIRSN